MEWNLWFCYERSPDRAFIINLLEYLVSRGAKYNKKDWEDYLDRGHYSIYAFTPSGALYESIDCVEKEAGDSTEKLFKISDTYLKYDLNTTSLRIWMVYFRETNFRFALNVVPDGHGKCGVSLETNNGEIFKKEQFFAWVGLCRDVFARFDFAYGALRNDYEEPISLDLNEFLKELPNYVNFYSRQVADRIGRERLLSAPAREVEELGNGGIMIVVCPLYDWEVGCPDEIDKLWAHLGYDARGR